LNQAPFGLATQQRHQIFKKELQKRVVEGAVLASAPCGLMADLLELDFSGISHFALTGIDLDTETLGQAKSLAASHGLSERCEFLQRDAWDLETEERFDVLTSNGLSIYEPSEARVVDLYREFFKALKPGGHLIASFLTPPPVLNPASEWNLSKINQTDALMQKILLADIINSKWQTFRTSEAVKRQLESAGFEAIEFIYDEASIFPTVTARKPL
jgi:SAM-dependent methyltransferase